ncbi:MAG: polysaccharide deacetylase family protein [Rhodospirillaceae bacterium]
MTRRDAAKKALWRLGVLTALHRLCNRRRLTVVMFHRVLRPGAVGWRDADPLYTVSDTLFAACLDFFKRHYRVIGLAEMLAARDGVAPLPLRPLLITFDDGWADTATVALPLLTAAGLPALVFPVSDPVRSNERLWWQEVLVTAIRHGRLDPAREAALWRAAAVPPSFNRRPPPPAVRPGDQLPELLAALATLDAPVRREWLAPLAEPLEVGTPRHMLTSEETRRLPPAGIAVGCHGASHAPLTAVSDIDAELATARRDLNAVLGSAVTTLSFPHGRYNATVLAAARARGFSLMFSSDPRLNPTPAGYVCHDLLGRISIPAPAITDPDGRFRPELLALRLFTAPVMMGSP